MRYQTSRAMRAVAAEKGDEIADMISTQNRRAATHGWDDPMIDEIELDIVRTRQERANLIARANNFGYAA